MTPSRQPPFGVFSTSERALDVADVAASERFMAIAKRFFATQRPKTD